MSSIDSWAVGVTTAPRRLPTLERCVRSIAQAGWQSPRLFVDGDCDIPEAFGHLDVSHRASTLGAFPNWYLGLTELYLRHPRADAYLMCQDDVLLARGLKEYLEEKLWPAEEIGVLSLYCPSHEHRDDAAGFCVTDPGWEAWGALAYLFSNPGVRAFLSDANVLNHRHHGPAEGLRNIDSVVGGWCRRRGLPYFVHVPSLAQHIGETSTIWKRGFLGGRRSAIEFDADFPLGQSVDDERDRVSEVNGKGKRENSF